MSESRWAAGRFIHALKQQFESGWQATPDALQRSWARTMLAGIITTFAVLFVMMCLLRYTVGAQHFAWEETVLHAIGNGPVGFGTAVWLQTFGADFMLVFVAGAAACFAVWQKRPLLAVTIVLSLVVMDAVVRIGWFSYARHRPQMIDMGMAAPAFHSFPSGHTAKTFALYGVLFGCWIAATSSIAEKLLAAILFAAIAVAVPYGRVRMGVHWPTDIIGGWILGAVWLIFAMRAIAMERNWISRSR